MSTEDDGTAAPHVAMTTRPYISEGAARAARRLARSLAVLFIVNFLLSAGILVYLSRQVGDVSRADASSCAFFRDLAGAPIVSASGARPSLLGVTLVADSRTAYRGLGCPGRIPPPGPGFAHWARYYDLSPG